MILLYVLFPTASSHTSALFRLHSGECEGGAEAERGAEGRRGAGRRADRFPRWPDRHWPGGAGAAYQRQRHQWAQRLILSWMTGLSDKKRKMPQNEITKHSLMALYIVFILLRSPTERWRHPWKWRLVVLFLKGCQQVNETTGSI